MRDQHFWGFGGHLARFFVDFWLEAFCFVDYALMLVICCFSKGTFDLDFWDRIGR